MKRGAEAGLLRLWNYPNGIVSDRESFRHSVATPDNAIFVIAVPSKSFDSGDGKP
jgi:hypothetical protein